VSWTLQRTKNGRKLTEREDVDGDGGDNDDGGGGSCLRVPKYKNELLYSSWAEGFENALNPVT